MKASYIILCIMVKGLTIETSLSLGQKIFSREAVYGGKKFLWNILYISLLQRKRIIWRLRRTWHLLTELVASIGGMGETIFCVPIYILWNTLPSPHPLMIWLPLPPPAHMLALESWRRLIQIWIFIQALGSSEDILGHPKGVRF